MAEHPLDLTAMAAYGAFAISAADRLGQMPDWQHIPPEARADWRAVADAVRMMTEASEAQIRADERERIVRELERRANELAAEAAGGPAFTAAAAVTHLDIAHLIREGLPDLERADD